MCVVVKLFDHFWKPNSLVSKFCVNCLLMFYFVYCINCGLKEFNRACNWNCSLVALRVLEMCFRAAKTRKNLEHFEMHLFYWPGGQTWFEHKWRKLVTTSLLLHCKDLFSCLRFCNEFYQLCFWFYIEVFSYCFLTETFAIGIQTWFDKESFSWGFLFENGLFRWLYIFIDQKLQEMLNCYSFFDDIKGFDV